MDDFSSDRSDPTPEPDPAGSGAAHAGRTVTLMAGAGSIRMGKCWSLVGGKPTAKPVKVGARFTARSFTYGGIRDLLPSLRTIASELPWCFIVRAAVPDGAPHEGIFRRLHGPSATLVDVARNLVAFDADLIDFHDGDPAQLDADTLAWIVSVLIARLPEEFHGRTCGVQFTGSHGFKGVRLRLWFDLSRPLFGREIESWVYGAQFDAATLRPVEPIFTANPELGPGIADPTAALGGRWHLIAGGAGDVVPVPDELPDNRPEIVRQFDRGEWDGTSVGVAAFLALMGDGPGLGRFDRVIVQAVASYAGQHGAAGLQAGAEALKAQIRAAIEAAPRSPVRDPADLVRYAGDRFLDELIASYIGKEQAREPSPEVKAARQAQADRLRASAAAKRAARAATAGKEAPRPDPGADMPPTGAVAPPCPPPAPELPILSPAAMVDQTRRALAEFLADPAQRVLVLADPPGGGKTEAAIAAIPKGATALIMVPTMALAEEQADRARKLGRAAGVFRGRQYPGLCGYAPTVAAAGAAGVSVARVVCGALDDEPGERCPSREHCSAAMWYSQSNRMMKAVTVVAHNYLPVEMDNWPTEFDIVIVDEKFYSTMIYERRLKLRKIIPKRPRSVKSKPIPADDSPLMWQSIESCLAGGRPIADSWLTRLNLEELQKRELARLNRMLPRPGDEPRTAIKALGQLARSKCQHRIELLDILLSGFDQPVNDRYVLTGGVLRLFLRRELADKIAKAKKIIANDFDWSDRIGGKFFAPDRVVRATVRFNAELTQVVGGYSRETLVGWYRDTDGKPAEGYAASMAKANGSRRRLEQIIAAICRDGLPTLVVAIRDLVAPNARKPAPPEGYRPLKLPACCERAWFGALLGRDEWKGFARAIVIGQPSPGALTLEGQARSLGGNDPDHPLTLPGEFRPTVVELRDTAGRVVRVTSPVHVDPLVRDLADQVNSKAIGQAIHRLRMVHRADRAEAWYFGQLALDMPVDMLTDAAALIDQTHEEKALIEHGVAPLSAAELAVFAGVSASAIANRRARERVPLCSIDESGTLSAQIPCGFLSILTASELTFANYRRVGQSNRGSAHIAAARGADLDAVEITRRLELVLGVGTVRDLIVRPVAHAEHRPQAAASAGTKHASGSVKAGERRAVIWTSGTARRPTPNPQPPHATRKRAPMVDLPTIPAAVIHDHGQPLPFAVPVMARCAMPSCTEPVITESWLINGRIERLAADRLPDPAQPGPEPWTVKPPRVFGVGR